MILRITTTELHHLLGDAVTNEARRLRLSVPDVPCRLKQFAEIEVDRFLADVIDG
jgi:hypothetical protein